MERHTPTADIAGTNSRMERSRWVRWSADIFP